MDNRVFSEKGAVSSIRIWATEILGPMPGASLRALSDLGLNDAELARYLRVTPRQVQRMRRCFGLPGSVPGPDATIRRPIGPRLVAKA